MPRPASCSPLIAEHPRRPSLIGIAGYPEGHPLISDAALEESLREKSRCADYVTTQMCFDPELLRDWIGRHREDGMTLPVVLGMPGKVARRKLLGMSARSASARRSTSCASDAACAGCCRGVRRRTGSMRRSRRCSMMPG